ncbi:MAG: hypothetical protein WCH35_13985, partial [Comamonadaceae bacterium]
MPGWIRKFAIEPPMLKSKEIDALMAGRSLWSDARRRFLRNKAAVISL